MTDIVQNLVKTINRRSILKCKCKMKGLKFMPNSKYENIFVLFVTLVRVGFYGNNAIKSYGFLMLSGGRERVH